VYGDAHCPAAAWRRRRRLCASPPLRSAAGKPVPAGTGGVDGYLPR